jgi:hypothetical protein
MAALTTFSYNIAVSLALAPLGFIGTFIRDARKRGCKCSEKVAPEPENQSKFTDSIPPQIMIVSENGNQSEPQDLTADLTLRTKELEDIKILGKIKFPERYKSAFATLYAFGYRIVFIFIHIKNRNYVNPALFAIDFSMAAYFGVKKMYCPGCLYNDLHVLIYKRKFVHVSLLSPFTSFSSPPTSPYEPITRYHQPKTLDPF